MIGADFKEINVSLAPDNTHSFLGDSRETVDDGFVFCS
jgi:hypothetical protein